MNLSVNKIANITGFDRRTVSKRLETAHKEDDGTYSLRSILEAYEEHGRGSLMHTSGDLDPIKERARKDKEQADKVALENQLRRGELVEVSDVKEAWTKHITNCRARLLGIATKLAPLLVAIDEPKEAQSLIDEEVRDALEELSGGADS